MPIVSVPLAGNLLQTSKNLGELLDIIAFPVGASPDPGKVRATKAFHMALDWLVNSTQWEYYLRRAASGTFTVGTAGYTVPERMQCVHNIRVTSGSPRPILPMTEDLYNKVVHDQSANSQTRWYHVQNKDQHSEIIFLPTPSSAENFQVDYYRDPAKHTDLATTPDIAAWMEDLLILRAQGYLALWKGRPDHVNFFRLAEDALARAISRDRAPHDEDNRFIDQREHGLRNVPWDHPSRSGEDYY
jgi:hypothetical protein